MDEAMLGRNRPRKLPAGSKTDNHEQLKPSNELEERLKSTRRGLVMITHTSDFMYLKTHVHAHVHQAHISTSARCCFVCW